MTTPAPETIIRTLVTEFRHGREKGVMPITTLPLSLYPALDQAVALGYVQIRTNERGRRFIVALKESE